MAAKPFVILDAEILNSSIWSEDPYTKLVWLTILILCDTEGNVGASLPGVARAAGVSLEQADVAIKRFLSPDPHSRTRDHEGRRLEVTDRGWRILNFRSVLDRLSAERKKSRDRVRRWREHGWNGKDARLKYPVTGDICPCCGRPFQTPLKLYVCLDHDHKTGKSRDYICQSCNNLVGKAESGKRKDPFLLAYLERHSVTVTVTQDRPGNREKGEGTRDQEPTEGIQSGLALRAPALKALREAGKVMASMERQGPAANPLVGERRVDLEIECLRLVRQIAEKSGAQPEDVMATGSAYKGARLTKLNPATMTDDRLLNTVRSLRAQWESLEPPLARGQPLPWEDAAIAEREKKRDEVRGRVKRE